MRYQINHQTIYRYNQLVFIKPQKVRLRPRCDGFQKLHDFSIEVEPKPVSISHIIDLPGNTTTKLWFSGATEQLTVTVTSEVETYHTNPFNYLLESWALKLPIDYSSSLQTQLQPYLQSNGTWQDSAIAALAQEIYHEANGNTTTFLTTLNSRLYNSCKQIHRSTGEPWLPGITWQEKQGSCRDIAVLFIEICRRVGLAARFVSGYQEGDPQQDNYDLHAWAEVYLPGGGWRGYDPTQGLAVADRHIAVAANAFPHEAAPISGEVTPRQSPQEGGKPVESQMQFHLSIRQL